MEAIETKRVGRYLVEIKHDDSPESPREWDNLGRLWTFLHRHNSPDKTPYDNPHASLACLAHELFGPARDYEALPIAELVQLVSSRAVVLPIFVYEHGGIAYSTGAFSCPWDSGQCGWAIMTKAEILGNWGGKILTPARREKAAASLKSDVETYSQWANGEVYGFQVHTLENPDDLDDDSHCDDAVESCWGFYGNDAMEEGTEAAQHLEAEAVKADAIAAANALAARLGKLKGLIRAHAPLDIRAAALGTL